MDLTAYVNGLGREFVALAEAGGDDARELAERLTGPLESAIRMTLLESLSAAADEITTDLAPGSVQLRLRGRDPEFVVTPPPPDQRAETEAPSSAGPAPDSDLLADGDGPSARINVRMPEPLKAAVEEAAAGEGRSVNAWLVRAAALAVARTERDQRPGPVIAGKRDKRNFTGWVR
ncbi:MAG: hypothetical protein FWE35_09070 [Streptosporangiales bacterium]|nr:hypothetical protein [Streptosporangiales bacterium]